MKKVLFFAAAAIAMLTGCSQSDDLTAPTVAKQDAKQIPVEIGTYVGKSAQTRSGWTGDITDSELKLAAKANGFGVFAYFTENTDYPNVTATATPAPSAPLDANANTANFMYNQHVSWDATNSLWTYSPLKYWPNDFASTAVDAQTPAAQGSTAYGGKVSFFAYAPYVNKSSALTTTSGIIAINNSATAISAETAGTGNKMTGNPIITYKMASSGDNVDLLWGTCPTEATGNYSVAPSGTQTGGYVWGNQTTPSAEIKNYGKTNVNLTKQQTNASEASAEKVYFLFKHALAKVGGSSKGTTPASSGLQIKLAPDFGSSFGKGNETVVTVKYVKISQNTTQTSAPAYDHPKKNQGILDLATGIWTTSGDQDNFSQTIKKDADANEPSEAELNPNITEKTVNTTIDLVSNTTWADATGGLVDGTHEGVLLSAQPVYDESKVVKPLLYFPGETPSIDVEIEYVVRTKDPNLENGYSEATQRIKRTVTFGSAVQMNKRYNLMIILGLTSIKFEATVSDWDAVTDLDGDGNQDETEDHVNLPLNVQ